jgi:ABC-type glutathione transport system ATPase component
VFGVTAKTISSRFFRVRSPIAVANQHPHLNRAQTTVVEDVLSSPDRIQGIQGFAGSGKTTTLTVIRNVAEQRGTAGLSGL